MLIHDPASWYYDYSALLPYLQQLHDESAEKWCTTKYLEQKLDKARYWVMDRLWVAYHDGIVECKETYTKRNRVVYAWRLI